jgi:hypothetical protein
MYARDKLHAIAFLVLQLSIFEVKNKRQNARSETRQQQPRKQMSRMLV